MQGGGSKLSPLPIVLTYGKRQLTGSRVGTEGGPLVAVLLVHGLKPMKLAGSDSQLKENIWPKMKFCL